jgi:hypothetical protein
MWHFLLPPTIHLSLMRGKLLNLAGASPLTGVAGEEAATPPCKDPQLGPRPSGGLLTCSPAQEIAGGTSLPVVLEEARTCSASVRLWHPGWCPAHLEAADAIAAWTVSWVEPVASRAQGPVWMPIRRSSVPFTPLPGSVRGEIGRSPVGPVHNVPVKPQPVVERGYSNVITAC